MDIGASIAPADRIQRVDVGRLGLTGLVLVQLLVALVFATHRLAGPSDGTSVAGAGAPFGHGSVTVEPVGPGSAALIVAGDRVIAVLDRSVEEWADDLIDPTAIRRGFHNGDPIRYALERHGRPVEVTVIATSVDAPATLASDWGVLLLALSIQVCGLYLFARRPAEPAARALLIAGTGMFASSVPWALGLQVTDLATGVGFWLYALAAGVAYSLFWSGLLHFALVFPRPVPFIAKRGWLVALAYLLPLGAQVAWIAGTLAATGHVLPALGAWIDGQAILQVVAVTATLALLAYSYVRLVDPVSRLKLRWVAGAAALAGLSGLLLWFGPQLIMGEPLLPRSAVALLALPFPIALAIAIDRHHLFDLDKVLNRSLVYGGLTVGIIATYALTVALIGGMIPGNAPYAIALLGAGAAALAALPLRDGMQRSVNRVMYGDRDEPDRALRRLGRRLEASLDPQTVLPTLVDAVAEAMRSPYVAIEFEREHTTRIEAVHGSPPIDHVGPREPVRVPIVYRGEMVGRLVVAPRGAGEAFSAADTQLLADLARQAAPAIEAVRLTGDLRRSREELVATREEERRRLRRDLHDELGPALAGSLMKLGAARSLMAMEPTRAGELLRDLESDARTMIEEVRRIARDLRPPALDELGLIGVLRQRVATFDGGSPDHRLSVSLDAPDSLPPLPAAVEVAALRIALEGLTNAARHSQAGCARIAVGIDDEALTVSIVDDGVGIDPRAEPGVGLASMRARADELGGKLTVEPADGGGTIVLARLPITMPGNG